MFLNLGKRFGRRDVGKELCEGTLKDVRPKFIIMKQERPKIAKR